METIKKRLDAVDLARGLAVLFMICVHVLEVYANPGVFNSAFGKVVQFLGGPPAAPVFMMLMGLSFAYSGKKDLKTGVIRGVKVFLSGYLLNLLRGVVPVLFAGLIGLPVAEGMTPEQNNLLNIFLIADILQFAGIALIIMAIIREIKINRYVLIATAFLISMLSPFLWKIKIEIPVIEQLADLFWGDKPLGGFMANMVNFPIFPWITFPLIGMVVGEIFADSSDLQESYRKIGIIGGLIMITGLVITLFNPGYHINDYYHSRQGAMIFMSGFTLLWLYLCNIAIVNIKRNIVLELLYDWSRNVTIIYFIQWVLMTWGIAIFGMNESSFPVTLFIIILIAVSSHYLSHGYSFLVRKTEAK